VLPTAPSAQREDVLLLTEIVEEPKSMPNEQPAEMPRMDAGHPSEKPRPSMETTVSENPAAMTSSGETLVGAVVAGAASSAFARLNQAVQDSVPPPAATDPGPRVGGSGQTIEDLVKEMLRPMLKEWLDTNLPPMVERYVEREIARLTRR
jgi:cell pole-organizing protein PopZ